MFSSIRDDIIAALLTTILLATVGYALGIISIDDGLLLQAGISLVIFFILLLASHFFLRQIIQKIIIWLTKSELKSNALDPSSQVFKKALLEIIGSQNGKKIQEVSGLTGWFDSYQDSLQNIEVKIISEKTRSLKLLTYISEMKKGSILYESIVQNPNSSLDVKILLCSLDSPYVSEDFATTVNHSKDQSLVWKRRIQETLQDITHLRNHHSKRNIEARVHSLPFVWSLWFVDETLFVTAKLHYSGKENNKLPIYVIERKSGAEAGLYEMFERFFDREWKRAKNVPTD